MAEAVVSAVVDQLVSAGADWLKEEISLIKGVKPELDNIKNKMETIQTVLEDAENQSVKKKIVKKWLKELQDVSYDMEDVLDEWSTRVHMLEREREREDAEENHTSSPSPTAVKLTWFSLKKLHCISYIKQLCWGREIALRIKSINEKVDSLSVKMKDFEFKSNIVRNDDMNKIINSKDIVRTTTSSIDESKVFGRGDNKGTLLEKVLSINTEQEKCPQVISIVGSGGLGKTTLAQLVYNDGEVKEKFGGNRIWVCVSDPFDEVKVAKDILEELEVDHTKMTSLQALHKSIEKSLSGNKKFLLVLDDVWNEDSSKWERLRTRLKHGDPGSRILVTTRKDEVASIMGTSHSNILKPQHLSDSDCWSLMSQIAFEGRTNKDNDKFQDIGEEIAKKCGGLPLAAKVLGSMLKSKDSVDKWNEILYSDIWKLEQVEGEIFPHIFLSYQELPAILKRCFLILAIFPKDNAFKVRDVIGIWMAHGFLNPRTKKNDMVNTCQKYLEFLVSCALLEKKDSEIFMHDIIHDFALHRLGDEVSVFDKIENDGGSTSMSERGLCLKSTMVRHLYIDGKYIDHLTSIESDVEKLRTCIIRRGARNITLDLVKRLKMVRTLCLVKCGLEEVPEGIKNLIHLRLLNLNHNPLVELPETIGGLYNLQTLLLRGTSLSTLPDSIGKLTNLIFLETDWTLEKYPESVGKLINLHELGIVPVGAKNGKLGFLKDLNQLRGNLQIDFKSEYGDEVDVKKAAIQKKKHITKLGLDFTLKKVTDGVIAALQPPSNIQKLRILNLDCSSLPGWITSLRHLTELNILGVWNIWTLPPLGELRYLEILNLATCRPFKKIGREFWGHKNDEVFVAFPSLLELEISNCELEEWSDIKAEDEGKVTLMPKLRHLEVSFCRKLQVLPSRFLSRAASLEELQCRSNNSSLDKYIKNNKQLLERVKNVTIDNIQYSLHPLKSEIRKDEDWDESDDEDEYDDAEDGDEDEEDDDEDGDEDEEDDDEDGDEDEEEDNDGSIPISSG